MLAALEAEHAAVFAYGVLGAFTNPSRADQVAVDSAAHRARRDATIDLLTSLGETVPPPAAGYRLPAEVTDQVPAAQMAELVETDTAVAWRAAVERADDAQVRTFAIDALGETAVRLARWRAALGAEPATLPLPGTPDE
nr:ferritin-like domain-containing protein [Rhodococcus sp. HNM0569]